MEIDPVLTNGQADGNFCFLFKLVLAKRDLIMGSRSISERQKWINGFNVLFEFREHQNRKVSALMPGGFDTIVNQQNQDKKQPRSHSQQVYGNESLGDMILSAFNRPKGSKDKQQDRAAMGLNNNAEQQ